MKYFSRLHFDQKRKLCSSASNRLWPIRSTRRYAEGGASSLHPRVDLQIEKLLSRFPAISVPRITGHLERKPCNCQLLTSHILLTFNFHVCSKSSLYQNQHQKNSTNNPTNTCEAHPINMKTLRHPKSKNGNQPLVWPKTDGQTTRIFLPNSSGEDHALGGFPAYNAAPWPLRFWTQNTSGHDCEDDAKLKHSRFEGTTLITLAVSKFQIKFCITASFTLLPVGTSTLFAPQSGLMSRFYPFDQATIQFSKVITNMEPFLSPPHRVSPSSERNPIFTPCF